MQNIDKDISEAVNQQLKNCTVNITAISNCITYSWKQQQTYSFFNIYDNKGYIAHELVTIAPRGQDKNIDILRHNLFFGNSYFKSKTNQINEISIQVMPNPSNSLLSLVLVKYKKKNHTQTVKLCVFQFDQQKIFEDVSQQLQLQDLLFKKTIRKAQWHPLWPEYFIVLTEDSFDIFEYQEGQLGMPSLFFFRELSKNFNKIVDFSLWPSTARYQRLLLAGLTQTGKLCLFCCILGKINDGTEQENRLINKQFDNNIVFRFKEICNTNRAIGQSNVNWEKLQVVSSLNEWQQQNFIVTTSCYRETNKHSAKMFFSYLQFKSQDTLKAQQKNLFEINFNQVSQNISQYQIQFFLALSQQQKSSFYFIQNNKLFKVCLKNQIKTPTQVEKTLKQSYIKTQQEIKCHLILDFSRQDVLFLNTHQDFFSLLRKGKKSGKIQFRTFSKLLAELKTAQQSVSSKMESWLFKVRGQIKSRQQKIKQQSISDSFKSKVPIFEKISEQELKKFFAETEQYINKMNKELKSGTEKSKVYNQQIKVHNEKFDKLYTKRQILHDLINSIRKNEDQIRKLITSQAKNNEESEILEKCQQIKDQIDFSRNKQIEMPQNVKNASMTLFQQQNDKLKIIESNMQKANINLHGFN